MAMSTRFVLFAGLLLLAQPAWAYVDPGTFGLVSQWGYILLIGAGSIFALGFRRIKSIFLKLFRRGKAVPSDQAGE